MRQIFPVAGTELPLPPAVTAGPLPPAVAELARLYGNVAGPVRSRSSGDWWLRANMVASIDGAVSVDGRSGGLSGPADRALFTVLRSLADVILVGTSTARAEKYRPASAAGLWPQLRDSRPLPPIALITPSLRLDGCERLLDQPAGPSQTIVITTGAALTRCGGSVRGRARVIEAGQDRLDWHTALAALGGPGAALLCEGGPTILGLLTAAGVLDELCVTTSPLVAGGRAGRIVAALPGTGAQDTVPAPPLPLQLAHVLADGSFLFSRYLRADSGSASGS